ncbi:MAG: hypothetical protein H8E62_09500 [Planctomycetes bacterium]|nr:hypothetical protein [Planctomycetota bacterium]
MISKRTKNAKNPYVTGKNVIVIWAITKLQDYKVYAALAAEIPPQLHFDRAGNLK